VFEVSGADDGVDADGSRLPAGTFYFQNSANMLDQFLVGKNMIGEASPLWADPASVAIVRRPAAMVRGGVYPGPVPFGRGASLNEDGYSDHFPIALRIRETA
jgi:hypothetical protein